MASLAVLTSIMDWLLMRDTSAREVEDYQHGQFHDFYGTACDPKRCPHRNGA